MRFPSFYATQSPAFKKQLKNILVSLSAVLLTELSVPLGLWVREACGRIRKQGGEIKDGIERWRKGWGWGGLEGGCFFGASIGYPNLPNLAPPSSSEDKWTPLTPSIRFTSLSPFTQPFSFSLAYPHFLSTWCLTTWINRKIFVFN